MAGAVEQDIVGLDVAVYDALAVCVAERVRDLARDPGRVDHGEAPIPLEQLPHRRAVDAAHDDVEDFVLVAADLVDRHDVRVLELPAGARLAHEALRQPGRRGQAQVEHLHGDVAVLRMVAHAEHGGEAAFAQQIPDRKFLAECFLEAATQRGEIERHGGRET